MALSRSSIFLAAIWTTMTMAIRQDLHRNAITAFATINRSPMMERRTHHHPTSLDCHLDSSDDTTTQRPIPAPSSQPIWTSRRGMMASSAAAVTAGMLGTAFLDSNTNNAAAAPINSNQQQMADVNNFLSTSTRQALIMESSKAVDKVTAANIEEYRRTGVTCVKNVVSDYWLEALRDGCILAQDEAGPYAEYLNRPTDAGIFFTDLEMGRRLPLFAAFSLYGPAAAIAGTVMGSNSARYLYDQLFVKEKGVSTITPWHQDGGYWRVKGNQIASVFVPLDPVQADDGLQFVSGSHTWPLHNPQHFADGTPYHGTSLPEMPDVSNMAEKRQVQLATFALEPGDVLVFSARTAHGGPGNWGRALSTRWVGDDARFWDRPGEGAVPTIDVNLKDGEPMAANPNAFPCGWGSSSTKHA